MYICPKLSQNTNIMKKSLLAATMLILCIACGEKVSTTEKLNTQAISEYNIPIRPGYEGKNPYWNKFSKKFMYAPAFDFKAVDGATLYKYTITQEVKENAKKWSFTAEAPNLSLAPVWQDIEVGNVTLTVEALDKEGKTIASAGERKFYRDAPFKGPRHEAVRSYKEAALMALLYIHNMKAIQNWKNDTLPDMSYELNTYPCKIIGSTISAEVMLARLCPQVKDEALKIAENAAKFLINQSRPEGDPLAYFPPTYYGNYVTSGASRNKGKTMAMEALTAAEGFLDLYDITGKQEYYDRAINITETYARMQAEDGSFPIKMDFATGEPVNKVRAMLHPILEHLSRLEQQYGVTKYTAMREKAESWMKNGAMKTFDMTGQFEDGTVLGLEPYENLTNCTAAPYASYLLNKTNTTPDEIQDAIDLIRFSEDQFTYWESPVMSKGINLYLTPCVAEQYKYMVPIDHSACNMANAWLSLYENTGDQLSFVKAKAIVDNITIVQNSTTGLIPTFWRAFLRGTDWINCSYLSIKTLLRMDEMTKKAE